MTTRTKILAIAVAGSLAAVNVVSAQSPLNPTLGIADNLKALATNKAAVTVVLNGGQIYTGKVASVGDHQVLLTELSGKEFFDALIDLDEVAAIEARARK